MKSSSYLTLSKTVRIILPRQLKITGHDNDEMIELAEKEYSFSINLQRLVVDLLGDIPNAHVLNAGANIGLLAIPLSLYCAKLYAVEPIKPSYEYLLFNISQNKRTNIEAFNFALSDKKQLCRMKPCGNQNKSQNSGHSVVVDNSRIWHESRREKFDIKSFHKVPAKTIDSMNLEKLDLILLDVEGYEIFALRGAKETIQKHKPILIIEHEKGHILSRHSNSESIIKEIMDMGYDSPFVLYGEEELVLDKDISLDSERMLTKFKSLGVGCLDLLFYPNE